MLQKLALSELIFLNLNDFKYKTEFIANVLQFKKESREIFMIKMKSPFIQFNRL